LINDDGPDDEDIEIDFSDDTALARGTTLLPERNSPVVESKPSSPEGRRLPSCVQLD